MKSSRFFSDEEALKATRWEAFRASGPGGQKRNKTSSAIRLVHVPTGISAIANESRSQAANRRSALHGCGHRMAIELREPMESDPLAVPAWFASICPAGRLKVSPRSAMYLPAVGFVLDVLAARGWSVSEAAASLELSTGGLVRFLQQDDKMMAHVNAMRLATGLKALGSH